MKLLIDIDKDIYESRNTLIFPLLNARNAEAFQKTMVKAIQNGKPLDSVLDEIRAEIPRLTCGDNQYRQALVKVADVVKCIDKYRKENADEKKVD